VCAPEVALASMDSRSPRTRSRIGASAQHQRAQKSHWCLGTTPTRTEVALVFLAHHQRAPQSHFIHLLCIIYSLYLAHHHFLLHFFLAFAFTLLRHHFSFISFLLLLCSAIIFFFIFFLLLLLLCFASPSFFSSFLSFLLCFALLRHHFFLFIFSLAFAFALLCFASPSFFSSFFSCFCFCLILPSLAYRFSQPSPPTGPRDRGCKAGNVNHALLESRPATSDLTAQCSSLCALTARNHPARHARL
jgi:hypothetical protein